MSMKKNTSLASAFVSGIAICTATISLSACQPVNTRNDPSFVDSADRFVNVTVGPEYESMLDGTFDPSALTEDEIEDRKQNVRTFRAAVAQAKLEVAETATPTEP